MGQQETTGVEPSHSARENLSFSLVMASNCCDYELLTPILAQNKNTPHFE